MLMTERRWPYPPPQFEVTAWRKGILFDLKAIWNFLVRSNIMEHHPVTTFLFNYVNTDTRTFFLNLASPFGRAVKKIPFPRNTDLIIRFLYQSQFIRKNYVTTLRCLPLRSKHLTFLRRFHTPSSTHPSIPSLHNLIRNRLNTASRTNPLQPSPVLPLPHKTYLKNRYISYPPPTTCIPPITPFSGFDPPSRYPREGVG